MAEEKPLTPLTKFDPASYIDKLRDKMKQSMIDIIPDEQWDLMLKSEIDAFFTDKVERGSYSQPDRKVPSAFKQAAQKVLEEECKKRVAAMLQEPEWAGYWSGQKTIAGTKIGEMVQAHGAQIMTKWIEAAVQQVVSDIRFSASR